MALKDGDPAPKGTEGSDGPTIIEPLLGSWKCISSTDATKSKTTKDLMVGVILTINSNGTYTTNSTDMGEQGNYIVKGNSLTAKAGDKTIQATYSLNDNQLTISGTTNEGITFNYVFVKITSLNIERLVGTWECVSSIDKSSKETLTDIMVGEFLYIRDDGTYTTTSSEMGKKGTYKLLGNILTVKTEGRTIEIMLSLNGSQLTMTGSTSNGYSFTYVFEKVSSGIHAVHSQSPVIFSKNGVLTITGIAEGTPITVYSVAGMLVGSEVSRNGSAVLSTRLQPGSVAVVQIGSRKFKVAVR